MSELSKQLELLESGSIEIALLYDGLTELRKRCVKLAVFAFCEDMKNPYSTFEADLQKDLDRLNSAQSIESPGGLTEISVLRRSYGQGN